MIVYLIHSNLFFEKYLRSPRLGQVRLEISELQHLLRLRPRPGDLAIGHGLFQTWTWGNSWEFMGIYGEFMGIYGTYW